jgi:hypothetical protein
MLYNYFFLPLHSRSKKCIIRPENAIKRIMERCQSGRPDSYREGQPAKTSKKKGEMPEWSIGAVSKTVDLARGPRVRIPISPLLTM